MIDVTALPIELPALAAPPKLAVAVVHTLRDVFLGGILEFELKTVDEMTEKDCSCRYTFFTAGPETRASAFSPVSVLGTP